MSYEFGVGEYRTRGGHKAIVRFVLQQPNTAAHQLVGEIYKGGWWHAETWTHDGFMSAMRKETEYDLMPPEQHRWRNMYSNDCGSHWFDERRTCDDFVLDKHSDHHIGYLHEIRRGDEVRYEFVPKEKGE